MTHCSWRRATPQAHGSWRPTEIGFYCAGAAGGASRIRQQHWRRRSKPARDTNMDVPADFTDNATTSASAHYLHALDPLVLEMCVSVGHHEWDNPMLEDLTASLVVSRPAGAPTPACLPATVTAPRATLPWGAARRRGGRGVPRLQQHPPRRGCGHPYPATARGTAPRHGCRGMPVNPTCGDDHPSRAS